MSETPQDADPRVSEDPRCISSCVLGVLYVKDGGDDENGGLTGPLGVVGSGQRLNLKQVIHAVSCS